MGERGLNLFNKYVIGLLADSEVREFRLENNLEALKLAAAASKVHVSEIEQEVGALKAAMAGHPAIQPQPIPIRTHVVDLGSAAEGFDPRTSKVASAVDGAKEPLGRLLHSLHVDVRSAFAENPAPVPRGLIAPLLKSSVQKTAALAPRPNPCDIPIKPIPPGRTMQLETADVTGVALVSSSNEVVVFVPALSASPDRMRIDGDVIVLDGKTVALSAETYGPLAIGKLIEVGWATVVELGADGKPCRGVRLTLDGWRDGHAS
jgi:hypothetical protein